MYDAPLSEHGLHLQLNSQDIGIVREILVIDADDFRPWFFLSGQCARKITGAIGDEGSFRPIHKRC
jgi:hypothetical protein